MTRDSLTVLVNTSTLLQMPFIYLVLDAIVACLSYGSGASADGKATE